MTPHKLRAHFVAGGVGFGRGAGGESKLPNQFCMGPGNLWALPGGFVEADTPTMSTFGRKAPLPRLHWKLIRSLLGTGAYMRRREFICVLGRDGRLAADRAGATESTANQHSSYRRARTDGTVL